MELIKARVCHLVSFISPTMPSIYTHKFDTPAYKGEVSINNGYVAKSNSPLEFLWWVYRLFIGGKWVDPVEGGSIELVLLSLFIHQWLHFPYPPQSIVNPGKPSFKSSDRSLILLSFYSDGEGYYLHCSWKQKRCRSSSRCRQESEIWIWQRLCFSVDHSLFRHTRLHGDYIVQELYEEKCFTSSLTWSRSK